MPVYRPAFHRHALPVLLALAWFGTPAQAESLRCNNQSAQEGDSRISVLYKCGEPVLRDTYCAPLVINRSLYPADPYYVAPLGGPCVETEEWLYDRGPGNLMATVRFRGGVVQSILYGRSPR